MASIELSRNNAWEIDHDTREEGVNGEVRANGSQHGLWSFSLNGIRSAIGNRKIKVTGLTFLWETSAKFTYDTYIGTEFNSGAAYLVSAKGSGSYYVEIGSSTSAQAAMSVLENCINDTDNNTIYVSIYKSGSTGGNGYCRYGRLIVSYELGTPVVTQIIGDITKSVNATTFGSSVNYSIQVYNTLQDNMTQVKLEFYRVDSGTNISVADTYTLSNISVGTGSSTTISSTVQFKSTPDEIGRSTPTYVKVTISRGGDNASQSTSFVTLLDKLYNPTINVFNLSRCSNVSGTIRKDDSGEQMMTDIQIGLNSNTVGSFTLKVYYEENGTASSSTATSINLGLSDVNLANFKTGYYNSTDIISQSCIFGNESAWGFRLVLTDEYESASVSLNISKSFANMHLAGLATGGVAFGRYSTSVGGDNPLPKLESEYRAYFYNGIDGCDYLTSEVKTPFKWTDGKPVYRTVVEFTTTVTSSNVADLTSLSIKKVINISGVIGNGMPIMFYSKWNDDDYISITVDVANKQLKCKAASGYGGISGHCILEYTKASDYSSETTTEEEE